MKKRRCPHGIVEEILKTARGGEIKTHIMYKAGLSHPQISEYLNLLIEKGFVEKIAVKRESRVITMYRTTEKGIEFLDRLESINKLWT